MRFCCAERRVRTPARSIDAAIVTEQAYGCNCRSANSNYCHSFAKAYFRRMVGIRRDFRHGMMLPPVASAVPSAEVANLQDSYAAPESTAVAILRKGLPASFHRAPSDGLHPLLFLRSIPDAG